MEEGGGGEVRLRSLNGVVLYGTFEEVIRPVASRLDCEMLLGVDLVYALKLCSAASSESGIPSRGVSVSKQRGEARWFSCVSLAIITPAHLGVAWVCNTPCTALAAGLEF